MRLRVKILHLVLTHKWFDKIKSGEKTKEYREAKPYWNKRLGYKKYDLVKFRLGYAKNAETMTFKVKGIYLEQGIPNDLNIDDGVWAIELGERVKE